VNVAELKRLGLVIGAGRLPASKRPGAELLKWCHGRRLRDGLSIALSVTPDEAIGALCHAMGGNARQLKVLDVRRGSTPALTELEVRYSLSDPLREEPTTRTERWEVEGVLGLVHNLDDLFRGEPGVKPLVVLGEWEDMLQVWALERPVLRELLDDGTLDLARNAPQLRSILDG